MSSLACDKGQADCRLSPARAALPGRKPGQGCRKGTGLCGSGGRSQSSHPQAGLLSEPRPPPGSSRRRGPGRILPAAAGASAELRAALLRPGGEPALPPARRHLSHRALHLPARHRGRLYGDRGDQNRQVGACARGCVWVWGVSPAPPPLVLSQRPAHLSCRARGLWEESRWAWSSLPPTPHAPVCGEAQDEGPGAHCPPPHAPRVRGAQGNSGILSCRRSIHSQEMLGQPLREVRVGCRGEGSPSALGS